MPMQSSLFAFATDFHDEGTEVALDRIGGRAGVGGVTLAAVYHHGRDIFPHSPKRKVRFLEGGACFFRPDARRYTDTVVQPHVSTLAREWDALAELREATGRRSMELHAWTVFLHNSRLGAAYPDCAVRNAFGDPQETYLCPANPQVQAYSRALAGDIARYGCDSLLAESLHYHPLEHGFHHERYLISIGPVDRLLLGLCFCIHCMREASRRGVDAERLGPAVRERLEAMFASSRATDDREDSREHIVQLWDGELDAFVRVRTEIVADLAAGVSAELEGSGTRFAFMDQAGAMKGYADGEPTGGPSPEVSWKIGVDPGLLADACDEVQLLAYAKDPERVRGDVVAYRSLVGDACELRAAFRPFPPDCSAAANLRAKLSAAAEAGVTRADLYHYGFARLETLDLVRQAIGVQR